MRQDFQPERDPKAVLSLLQTAVWKDALQQTYAKDFLNGLYGKKSMPVRENGSHASFMEHQNRAYKTSCIYQRSV